MEIEFLKRVDINIDYILMMVQQYHEKHCKDKEILVKISKAIESSPELRSKKDLIISFVNSVNDVEGDVVDSWKDYIREKKETELQQIILPPTSRFDGGNRDSIRVRVLEDIKAYFEKFWGME